MSTVDKTKVETLKHMERVRNLLNQAVMDLLVRGSQHDQSKLESPELELFDSVTASCTYGSEEYNEYKRQLGPALEHHYANNRHHPEHFANGVNDMNLLDLIEMFCDWKASSERHHDGNILKSIVINSDRFGMTRQLVSIFENTAKQFDYGG